MALCRIYEMQGGSLAAFEAVQAASGDILAAGARLQVVGEGDGRLYVVEIWPDRRRLMDWIEKQPTGWASAESLLPEPRVVEFDIHALLQQD